MTSRHRVAWWATLHGKRPGGEIVPPAMRTLHPLILLAVGLAACRSVMPPQRSPGQSSAEVGETLSARRALGEILEVIGGVTGDGREIRVRRISSCFRLPTGQKPASVVVHLDLDFIAAGEVEATRLQGALVSALLAREGCFAVKSDMSRAIGSGSGVYCDGFEVEMGRSGGRSLTEPVADAEVFEAVRSASQRLELGSVDVRKRISVPARGIEWCGYEIRSSSKQASFPLDAVFGLTEVLEAGSAALVVTGIELRPHDKVVPGAAPVESWSFEVEATGRNDPARSLGAGQEDSSGL